ncbi:MAG TPA: aldehyde dehydrogenase family protein [Pseudonocardiaceae bacterium]
MTRLRAGPGDNPATQGGLLVTSTHRQWVIDTLDIGVAEGVTIAAQAPVGDYCVPPTLFTHATPEMCIAKEETPR